MRGAPTICCSFEHLQLQLMYQLMPALGLCFVHWTRPDICPVCIILHFQNQARSVHRYKNQAYNLNKSVKAA